VYHVGASSSQVVQLLGLVHAEPPIEVLSEGGVRFSGTTAEDVIGSSVLHLSGEHGTSRSAHGIAAGFHLHICLACLLSIKWVLY
jgi:hypothetical protein